jgi:hypothetical protein
LSGLVPGMLIALLARVSLARYTRQEQTLQLILALRE